MYKDFRAPSFAATVVGEDSIQLLMLTLWVKEFHGWNLVLDASRLHHVIKMPCLCLQGSLSMLCDPAQAHLFKAEQLC